MKAEPRGQKLIDRYRANYSIPTDVILTEEMILKHWNLERALTQKLLASSFDNRWEIFEYCYSKLYAEIPWLNEKADLGKEEKRSKSIFDNWIDLIGPPPKKIYEIGSGNAGLIKLLAKKGYNCTATEITKERGQKHTDDLQGVRWAISDGVSLDRFEDTEAYDVVISDQVIEHLHPEDLLKHFKSVFNILVKNGRYILKTPHAHKGPSDISSVFNCDEPKGMHLKEYTYRELVTNLKNAGFKHIYTTIPFPKRITPFKKKINCSKILNKFYLNYIITIEDLIKILPKQKMRKKIFIKASRLFKFYPNIVLIAKK